MLPERLLIAADGPDTSGSVSAIAMILSSCGPILAISGIWRIISDSAAVSMPKAEVKAMKLLVSMEKRRVK